MRFSLEGYKMLPETSYIKPNNRSSDQAGCLKSWTLLFVHIYSEIGQNVQIYPMPTAFSNY